MTNVSYPQSGRRRPEAVIPAMPGPESPPRNESVGPNDSATEEASAPPRRPPIQPSAPPFSGPPSQVTSPPGGASAPPIRRPGPPPEQFIPTSQPFGPPPTPQPVRAYPADPRPVPPTQQMPAYPPGGTSPYPAFLVVPKSPPDSVLPPGGLSDRPPGHRHIPVTPAPEGRRSRLIAVLVLVGALLLAAAGTGAYVLIQARAFEPGDCVRPSDLNSGVSTVGCDEEGAYRIVQVLENTTSPSECPDPQGPTFRNENERYVLCLSPA